MSAFTDDDLKRLKSKEGYWRTSIKMNEGQSESWGFVDGDKVDALIARLEAAEWVAERFMPLQCDPTPDEKRKIKAWRKAAGKCFKIGGMDEAPDWRHRVDEEMDKFNL